MNSNQMNRESEKCLVSLSGNSFTQLLKTLSQGFWLAKLNRVRLEKVRGKFIHHMGYFSDFDDESKSIKVDFLYPEEALFLIENSNLIIHVNIREILQLKVTMSIQQCYEMMFGDKGIDDVEKKAESKYEIDLDCYKIYSNLVKNGFIVRRRKIKKNTSIPKISSKQTTSTKPSYKSSPAKVVSLIPRSDHERLTQSEIYSRLSELIPNVTIDELRERFTTVGDNRENEKTTIDRPRYLFEVNQADKRFQKSKPPKPEFNIFAPKENDELLVPDINDFIVNSADSKVQIYAFADEANQPIYYSFDFNFSIPSIVKE